MQPLKAAELAQQVGLRIYTIGIGAEQLEVSSLIGGPRNINPSADLDEETLTAIADMTGGRYFRAKDTAGLQDIYRLVDELEPVEEPEAGFRPVKSLYYVPLAGAFALASLAESEQPAAEHVAPGVPAEYRSMLAEFHFLRPDWLWALPMVILVTVLLAHRRLAAGSWRNIVSPALAPYVLSMSQSSKVGIDGGYSALAACLQSWLWPVRRGKE